MKYSEFYKKVSEKTGLTQDQANKVIKEIFNEIGIALENKEKVSIPMVGTFELRERQGRQYKNIKTKEITFIQPHLAPVFKFSDFFKKRFK